MGCLANKLDALEVQISVHSEPPEDVGLSTGALRSAADQISEELMFVEAG